MSTSKEDAAFNWILGVGAIAFLILAALWLTSYLGGTKLDTPQPKEEQHQLSPPTEVTPGVWQEEAIVIVERHDDGEIVIIYDDETQPMHYVVVVKSA